SLNFVKLNSNISLPTLPGLYLSLDCHVTGSSIESLDWFVNGELINNRNKFLNHDDILVIASKSSESLPLVNRTLILKLEESKPSMKYECKLNQNEIIRSHFIEIINQKPELDVQIDKSELNKLKLSFHIRTKRMHNQFQNLDNNPLKLSILYAENSTINTAFLTYIAPVTNKIQLSNKENNLIILKIIIIISYGKQACGGGLLGDRLCLINITVIPCWGTRALIPKVICEVRRTTSATLGINV
ncbi:hypothetical protein BpHYR1_008131, partial [Brachionus plicatilis]